MQISVMVVPGAKRESIAIVGENLYGQPIYRVKTTAKPVDNAANDAVKKMLADHFSVPPRCVTLIGGQTSRTKLYNIDIPC